MLVYLKTFVTKSVDRDICGQTPCCKVTLPSAIAMLVDMTSGRTLPRMTIFCTRLERSAECNTMSRLTYLGYVI